MLQVDTCGQAFREVTVSLNRRPHLNDMELFVCASIACKAPSMMNVERSIASHFNIMRADTILDTAVLRLGGAQQGPNRMLPFQRPYVESRFESNKWKAQRVLKKIQTMKNLFE